ncbi:hypothetical protein E4U43_007422 [Claviceps pusilla]|uniref:Aminoglycoside phosphotransferase domain-containing protein n=1 Tax=Claviceps pusilla TaxID=123648 RepID=A0A9P7T1L4_9HYPO|nr:hypothetical protein E4U43_007422 [Claviceps pusilla]
MARQLRKFVKKMQATHREQMMPWLGSAHSGSFCLLLDRHLSSTYWAVRPKPSHETFVAFLTSSFHPTVPKPVTATLAYELGLEAPAVFSHGDLCPRNIIVQGGQLVYVTGWDCAGWYPEWWEYVKFFEARTSDKNFDWYDYANEIFDKEFHAELAAYQGIGASIVSIQALAYP